ncbi:hypothetical protein VZT92_001305 [Zoarces viviparus]|uniref:Uncharacterized protein n=1 Tax=Zoarces viviparus TaxID=48416 RepID=A0AAW1G2T1_ZOAVI
MFQAITSKAERREGNERRAVTEWKAEGRRNGHPSLSAPACPLAATPLKHSPIRPGWRQKPATPKWGSEKPDTGGSRQGWRDEKRDSKGTALVDFMSLEPGVTASSPPATSKEKNKYGMWEGVGGGGRRKRRRERSHD